MIPKFAVAWKLYRATLNSKYWFCDHFKKIVLIGYRCQIDIIVTRAFSMEGQKSTAVGATDSNMAPVDALLIDVIGGTRLGQLLQSETRCDSGIASLDDASSLQQLMSRLMNPELGDETDGQCTGSQHQRLACVESRELWSHSNASASDVVEHGMKELRISNNPSPLASNGAGVDLTKTPRTAAQHVLTCSSVDSGRTKLDPVAANQSYHNAFSPNDDGDTLLHLALVLEEPLHIIVSIIHLARDSSDLDIQNKKFRQTALHLAVITDRPEVVEVLVKAGASVDRVDSLGRTPHHRAVQHDRQHCLAILVRQSRHHQQHNHVAAVNRLDYAGSSCLHSAVKSGNCFMVQQLVRTYGADINTADGLRGLTPLHIAVQMRSVELVECILEQPQVDVNRSTWDGVTALDFAIRIGSTVIESILRRASGLVLADYDDTDDDETDSEVEQMEI